MTRSDVAIVIPARYGSSRFEGKVLMAETGKPLLRHVWDQAMRVRGVDRVIVATDDDRIRAVVEQFGGEVRMTRPDHVNGTSRVAEVAATLEADLIVNLQGDEPELAPEAIEGTIARLRQHSECGMATLASPFFEGEDPDDPHLVKVVCDLVDRALYFSRARVPADRGPAEASAPLKHIGLYVYRRAFLLRYVEMAPTPLETAESLEQLRVLEHGERIVVHRAAVRWGGIDTPREYAAFVIREAERRSVQE